MIKKVYAVLSKIIAIILILSIQLIRPILGPMNICPYTVGCTQYALQQLKEVPLLTALKNIFQRLIQCHPFGNRNIL